MTDAIEEISGPTTSLISPNAPKPFVSVLSNISLSPTLKFSPSPTIVILSIEPD